MKMGNITVCMGVFNGASTLNRALDSVFAQTYKDFNVLVLDDGSTDDTPNILRQYDCRVITVPNRGIGAARRVLLEQCGTEYVAFLDSDDAWRPDKLCRQMGVMGLTDASLVHCDCWYVREDGSRVSRSIEIPAAHDSFGHILPNNKIIASSAVFRRDEMMAAGNYRDDLIRCSDWYGWLMLAPGKKFVYMPDRMVDYSVRNNSLANAGYPFYFAQHYLLTKYVIPQANRLFSGLPSEQSKRYEKLLIRDVGLALSGMARTKLKMGDVQESRKLAMESLRFAPGSTKVWSRALSCLFAAPRRSAKPNQIDVVPHLASEPSESRTSGHRGKPYLS